ncbi:MAG: 1-acyl-sn-glycerol-3-phosphate acyltransferase, partial [Bifidobacterium crudilactis]|nr:1-acyl-sn-glycerol-3-phosphate acyltransferase [Bifidobacterium crudilactis]
LQRPGTVIPGKGNTTVVFGKAIQVPKTSSENVTREQLRQLTDRMMQDIRALSGQEYVDMYAQVLKNSQKKG